MPPTPEERLAAPLRDARRPLLAVAFASIVVHGAAVSAFVIASGPTERKSPPQEIAVEVVQETPKPVPKPVPKPAALPPRQEASKAAASKPAPVTPPPPKTEPPPAKAAAEPPKPPLKPALPPEDGAKKLAELQKELDSLKAERAALEQDTAKASRGAGTLKGFDAAALPSIAAGGGDGDATSYEALVFSQLAKAKGIGARKGRAGTAGIRFEVDDEGHLVDVDVVMPSGVPELDAEAIAVVKRAAPFLPPPKGAQHVFMANFNFVPQAQ